MSKEPEYLPEHHEEVDEWHSHEGERPQEEHGSRVNAAALALAFLGTIISVVVIVVVVTIYFNSFTAAIHARKVETSTWAVESAEARNAAMAILDDGGSTPDSDLSFRPIDQAVQDVVRSYEDLRADAN